MTAARDERGVVQSSDELGRNADLSAGGGAARGGRAVTVCSMTRLLETNIFVQAARREYGLDFSPAFWDWRIVANAQGRVLSLVKLFGRPKGLTQPLAA